MHVQSVQKYCFSLSNMQICWGFCCRRRRGCLSSLLSCVQHDVWFVWKQESMHFSSSSRLSHYFTQKPKRLLIQIVGRSLFWLSTKIATLFPWKNSPLKIAWLTCVVERKHVGDIFRCKEACKCKQRTDVHSMEEAASIGKNYTKAFAKNPVNPGLTLQTRRVKAQTAETWNQLESL